MVKNNKKIKLGVSLVAMSSLLFVVNSEYIYATNELDTQEIKVALNDKQQQILFESNESVGYSGFRSVMVESILEFREGPNIIPKEEEEPKTPEPVVSKVEEESKTPKLEDKLNPKTPEPVVPKVEEPKMPKLEDKLNPKTPEPVVPKVEDEPKTPKLEDKLNPKTPEPVVPKVEDEPKTPKLEKHPNQKVLKSEMTKVKKEPKLPEEEKKTNLRTTKGLDKLKELPSTGMNLPSTTTTGVGLLSLILGVLGLCSRKNR